MKDLDDVKLKPQDLAGTAYRAFVYAAGERPEGPNAFEALGPDEAAKWLALALDGVMMTETGVSLTAREVADKMRRAFYGQLAEPSENVLLEEWLAWEGMARHMAYILTDYDERDNLEELERSWQTWAAEKYARIVHQPRDL